MRRFAAILASALVVMMLYHRHRRPGGLARNQRLSYNVGAEPATLTPHCPLVSRRPSLS